MRKRLQAILVGFAVFAAVLVLAPIGEAGAVPGPDATVFINEIHYDNTGADVGEFFEIAGPAGASLDGWAISLYNGSNGSAYDTIALSGAIPANGIAAFTPAALQNGSPDGLALTAPDGAAIQFLSYEGAFTATDGPAVGQTSTDIGVAEIGSTPIGQSLQLIGSGSTAGDFTWTGPTASSVGEINAGQTLAGMMAPPTPPGPSPAVVQISEVQGSGPITPLDGLLVDVQAIVTSTLTSNDALSGFFVQEEDVQQDGDPATSEGAFVFCGATCPGALAVGDLVDVVGVVEEFFDMTQINASQGSIAIVSASNGLPAATPVALGAGATTDAATFESVEGMIVTLPETLVASEYFQLARFGSIVLTANERPSQFTDTNVPSVAGYAAFLEDLATRRIVLDDDNNDQNDATTAPADNEPYAWPDGGLSATNLFRGGDAINGLTGVMHWAFGAWRIRPIDGVANAFSPSNPRPATVPDVGGSMTVAAFNVLNYFTTLDVPGATCGPVGEGCRGAHSATERIRQRDKIVAAIVQLDADVVGLMEIENDQGSAVADLVNALNAATSPGKYSLINTGFIGSDVIKQALIYQPATVVPIGDFAILDSSIDASFNDDKNRPALIQTFEEIATGGRVTVAVNHLKSKGSDCDDLGDPDLNDGAANCNLTRTSAATALATYLATDPTGSQSANALIIGDLNAYAMEAPIAVLKAAGYNDLVSDFGGSAAYTYLFDGQLGSLDYVMSNSSLTPQVTGAAAWNINADEIPLFDYNDDIQDAAEASFERESSANPLYTADAFRSSDHDPVIVGLDLAPVINPNVTISVMHNNDGESKLLPSDDFPGVARFVSTLKDLQANAGTDGVVTLTSGDNFLASKEFNASLDRAALTPGAAYYDSIALSGLYDAMALGNHDFDFGPDVTAAFISGFDPAIPFLSANADFAGEPLLVALENSGQLAASTVIDVAGTQVGVIGAVTPLLPTISSPRNVVISADVAGAVNVEVAALEAAGVNKIILISHLQGVGADRALIPLLSGVDIAIAGGGDELFANPGDTCDVGDVADAYPGVVTDADGITVPLVTGPGGYRCIGQLDATFSADGTLVAYTGSANLVPLDATPDPTVLSSVEAPIAAAVAALEANVIGTSEVDLDGVRTSVRTTSSNEGSLLADALLDAGQRLAPAFGTTPPVIGLQNGGGIRNDAVIAAGSITEGDTFDVAPFANFVVVTEVPRDTLKDLLEVAYGGLPAASGRFAQPAGFSVRIDPDGAAREIDSACAVIGSSGERVVNVALDDGTVIIENGIVVPGPDIALATIDFLARGGDCYPLGDLTFTALGVSYQQALADYITNTLNGTITAAQYPAAGTNRVADAGNVVPPLLSLPSDVTVAATSGAGAVVSFPASATDDIDGDIAVTCVPASGETFAIGVTTVECSATDSSLNTAVGSFDVIVTDLVGLTTREQIRSIAEELAKIDNLSRRDANRVKRAEFYLDRADRDRYWDDDGELDAGRGYYALRNIRSAISQLAKINDPAVKVLAQDLLGYIREAAQSNIDNAMNAGGHPYFLNRAVQVLDSGDDRRDQGGLHSAAYYYQSAWYLARLAIVFGGKK